MHLSLRLSLYIGRGFLASFALVFLIFLGIIYLFDTVELLRRAADHETVSTALVFQMGLLRLPYLAEQMVPFAVLFGGMIAFWRLTRSHELVVTRAAGVSAWQFMLPVLLLAILLGLFEITAFNPLASALLSRFDRLDAVYLKGETSLISVSGSGVWLRQANRDNQSVVHARRSTFNGREVVLENVTIFVFEGADRPNQRLEAEEAMLEDGFWHLHKVWRYTTGKDSEQTANYYDEQWFETDLTIENIHDSFAPPETMSFWALPGFIESLDRAGFSALRHRLHWHALLAVPLLLCAMILIAATFTLRQSRMGGTAFVIVGGILTGFLLFFFSDIVFALGLRESIPVALAAWTPSGVCALLGLAMVFHLEDG